MKYEKRRLQILKDYKNSLLRFLRVCLVSLLFLLLIFLVFKDNPYNLEIVPLLAIAGTLLVLLFYAIKLSYNNNYFLLIASFLIIIYSIDMSEFVIGLVFLLLVMSFLYELVFRFVLGVEIKFRSHELPWYQDRK